MPTAPNHAVITFDCQGRLTSWNESAQWLLQWTAEEMLGRQRALIHPPGERDADRLQAATDRARSAGAAFEECWLESRSGERLRAFAETSPLRSDEGELVGFVQVLRALPGAQPSSGSPRVSDRRLHRAQEVGGVGSFAVDLVSDRVFGSPQFHRIFGVPDAESLPARLIECLVLQADAHLMSDAGRRLAAATPLDVEYRIRRADDGALRWISRKAEYERNPDGTLRRLVGVVQDITERRETQRELEESAAKFRILAEALPALVWTALPNGFLDWFNDRVYQYTGAAPGELDGAGWVRVLHPDEAARVEALWMGCVASGDGLEIDFRLLRADGVYRWHLVRALPLRNDQGRIIRWVGTNTDVHESKLAQVEVTRDRDRIWTLSQELMLISDLQGCIAAVNPSSQRILGWTEDEMAGRSLADFIHPEDIATTTAELARLSRGVTTLAFENRWRVKGGGWRLFSWTAVPDGGYIHGVGRDVSRERAAEDSLRQSQKMEAIGQLTGGVAHDFNNVLAVVRNSVDLLRRLPPDDPRRGRFMDAIANAVDRATKLTGQLLAFARRQALQPVVFDVGQNVRAVTEMIASLTGARIEIVLQMGSQACHVNADPSQFDTALVNLAVNARDAMAECGRLTIAVHACDAIPASKLQPAVPGRYVAISVHDTGSGIAPEHMGQIFEPFFTTKGVGHGTGLGLSQVFGFARQSEGDIRVESTPGQGSTFTLYLPRALRGRPITDSHDAGGHRDEMPRGRGACVLVVEDNPELAMSVELMLQALGYTSVAVASAEAAIETLEHDARRFAVVFTDVVMAGMNGVELGEWVSRRFGSLPVVLTSGYSHVLAQNGGHRFALLHKPYAMEALAQVLHEACATVRRP